MSVEDYWFVPLGRERGGLLDLLGLPPDVDEVTVGNANATYQKEVTNGWKRKAREEKKKLDAGELSKGVFDSRKAEFKSEADELLMKLNALVAKYDAKQAALRRRKNEGAEAADPDPWRDAWKAARGPVRELVGWLRAVPPLGSRELDYVALFHVSCEDLERLLQHDDLLEDDVQYVIVDGELVEDKALEVEVGDFLDSLNLPSWADEQMVSSSLALYRKVEREQRDIVIGQLDQKLDAGRMSKRECEARKKELDSESAQLWDDVANYESSYHLWRERRCRGGEGVVRFARRVLLAGGGGVEEALEETAKEFLIWLGLQPWTDEITVALAKQAKCRALNGDWKYNAESLDRQRARRRISPKDFERRQGQFGMETSRLLLELDDLDRGYHLWRRRGHRESAIRDRFRRFRDEGATIADVAGLLAGLLIERDVQRYSTADRLWSEVGSTNRQRWLQRIEGWIGECSAQLVGFAARAVESRQEPLLPEVSRPFPLEAGRMSSEEEEFRRGPVRRVEDPMAAILASLLEQMDTGDGPLAGRRVGGGQGEDTSRGEPTESASNAAMRRFAALKALLEDAEAAHGRRPDLGRAKRS